MALIQVRIPEEPLEHYYQFCKALQWAIEFADLSDRVARSSANLILPPTQLTIAFGNSADGLTKPQFGKLAVHSAVIQIIAAVDVFLGRLLILRRWCEALAKEEGATLDAEAANKIRDKVLSSEAGKDPSKIVKKLIPDMSSELRTASQWLDGIYGLRVCLAHQGGQVGMKDTKGKEEVTIIIRKLRLKLDGQDIREFPLLVNKGQTIAFQLTDHLLTYKLGDQISLSILDVRDIATSLAIWDGLLVNEYVSAVRTLSSQTASKR